MSNIKSIIFRIVFLKCLFPLYYQWQKRKEIQKGSVLFIEVRLPALSSNYILLEKKLKEKGLETTCFLMEYGRVGQKQYIGNCFRVLKKLAVSQYAFLNEASNVISAVPLRKETKLVQVWHGCGAFKKFGYSIPGQLKEAYYKNYTFVPVSSPQVVDAYGEAMRVEKEKILPLGVSRTDIFYHEGFKTAAWDKLKSVVPECEGKKIILYAPTFRGEHVKGQMPNQLDVRGLQEGLGDSWFLLIKNHPFVRERLHFNQDEKNFAADVTDSMTIEELLCVSHLCISDYSSLIFEYSLFERPMVFFAYDEEQYYDERGFYYPYREMVPGPVVRTNEEIIDYIKHIEEGFDRQRVVDFKEQFMSACDGYATDRIVKHLLEETYE